MTTAAAARLVAAREIKVKLRDKTFLFSTAFFLLIAVASTVLPALLDGGPASVAVASSSESAQALRAAGLEVRAVASDADAERLVRDGDVEAAVVAGPRVLAMEEAPSEVVNALSTAPPVQLLDPAALVPGGYFAWRQPFGATPRSTDAGRARRLWDASAAATGLS